MVRIKRLFYILFMILTFPLFLICMFVDILLIIPHFIYYGEILDPDKALMSKFHKIPESIFGDIYGVDAF